MVNALARQKGGVITMDVTSENGKTRVFCTYVVRNGKRIYPKKSRYFTFLVDNNKNEA